MISAEVVGIETRRMFRLLKSDIAFRGTGQSVVLPVQFPAPSGQRRSINTGVLFLLLALNVVAVAQRSRFDSSISGPPVRDPQAIAAIEQALAALGGKDVQLQVHSVSLHGTVQIPGSQASGSFIWEDDLNGPKPEFRKELHIGDTVRVFVSGHGTPAESHDGVARRLLEHTALASPPLYLPGVVLTRALKYPHISIRQIDDKSGLVHIRISWDLNPVTAFVTPQHWYFDPKTFLPQRVEYRVPNTQSAAKAEAASLEFDDFRALSGVAVPFHIVSHGPDGQTRIFTVTGAETNVVFSANRFELIGGGQ